MTDLDIFRSEKLEFLRKKFLFFIRKLFISCRLIFLIGNKKVDKIITSFCNKDKTKAEQKAIAKRNLAWPTFTLFIFTINIRCKGVFIRQDSDWSFFTWEMSDYWWSENKNWQLWIKMKPNSFHHTIILRIALFLKTVGYTKKVLRILRFKLLKKISLSNNANLNSVCQKCRVINFNIFLLGSFVVFLERLAGLLSRSWRC